MSARKFRVEFAALSEPVTVLRRDTAGNFQVLGTWTPASNGVPPATYEPGDLGAALSRFGSPVAAPKPSAKPKR